jgi:hypothetical protein
MFACHIWILWGSKLVWERKLLWDSPISELCEINERNSIETVLYFLRCFLASCVGVSAKQRENKQENKLWIYTELFGSGKLTLELYSRNKLTQIP